MKRVLLIALACAVLAAGCGGGGSSSGNTGDFVTDLRAKSSKAQNMSDSTALSWGKIVCVTFDNGGSRSDAVGNIESTRSDSKASGDIVLGDISTKDLIALAIRDICPKNKGAASN